MHRLEIQDTQDKQIQNTCKEIKTGLAHKIFKNRGFCFASQLFAIVTTSILALLRNTGNAIWKIQKYKTKSNITGDTLVYNSYSASTSECGEHMW